MTSIWPFDVAQHTRVVLQVTFFMQVRQSCSNNPSISDTTLFLVTNTFNIAGKRRGIQELPGTSSGYESVEHGS